MTKCCWRWLRRSWSERNFGTKGSIKSYRVMGIKSSSDSRSQGNRGMRRNHTLYKASPLCAYPCDQSAAVGTYGELRPVPFVYGSRQPLDELRPASERLGCNSLQRQAREEDQPGGATHVSDHASTALVDGRSPRYSSQGKPSAKRPFKDS
jgi:hypothetical protein